MIECFRIIHRRHFGGSEVHFKKFLGTLPLYSLDKRNDKAVGCLVLIYNLIE